MKNYKYIIENTHGQWWTGSCWGVRQAAETYRSLGALPDRLPDEDGAWASLTIYETGEFLDAGYWDFAKVRVVK